MATLDVHPARLDYDLVGSGPALIQLHGLTSCRGRDALLGLNLARELSPEGHRVLRYDARGHGNSGGPLDPDGYTWPALAGDLLCLLDELLPGERVHGSGPSMGAGTLLHAAVRRPEVFRSLTLIIPPTAWATRPAQARNYLSAADLVEAEGVESFVALGATAPRPPAVGPDAPRSAPAIAAELLPAVFRGAARTDFPAPERVAGIEIPALILAWVDDPAHPLSTAERLAELLPNATLAVADCPQDLATWPTLLATHITDHD